MIEINKNIAINEDALKFSFIRASGPGGQNVNKVATAVQLKFDVSLTNLHENIKLRIIKNAGKKASNDGIIVIEAKRYRSQEKNRQDAINRLKKIILKSIKVRKLRKATKPTKSSSESRIEDKKRRGEVKKKRQRINKMKGDDFD